MTMTESQRRRAARSWSVRLRRLAATLAARSTPLVGTAILLLGVWLLIQIDEVGADAGAERQILVLTFDDDENPYAFFGNYLYQSLERQLGARVKQGKTSGSLDTLIQLDARARPRDETDSQTTDERGHTLGLTQPDVVYHYISGGHPQFLHPRADSHVRSLASVFSERLQFTWAGRETPTDAGASERLLLNARKICGGQAGSGTRVTVMNMARVLQASWDEFFPCTETKEKDESILAANATGFASDASVEDLLGFTEGAARVLQNSMREHIYEQAELGPKSGKYTVAWRALLVADQQLDDAAIEAVASSLREIDDACRSKDLGLPVADSLLKLFEQTNYCVLAKERLEKPHGSQEVPISLHPRLMLEQLDWFSHIIVALTDPFVLKIVLLLLLGMGVLASLIPGIGFALGSSQDRSISHRITAFVVGTRVQWVGMLLVAAAFHLLMGLLVWLSELHAHQLASDVDFVTGGVPGSVDWVWHFLILGSSKVELKSNLALLCVGILKAGWALASGALLVALAQTATRALEIFKMKRMAIIVGWNQHGCSVAEALSKTGLKPLILHSRALQLEEHSNWNTQSFSPLRGERNAEHSLYGQLTSAFKTGCKTVIVLGDHKQVEGDKFGDVDGWVARQVVEVQRARSDFERSLPGFDEAAKKPSDIRVVAEVENPPNTPVVRAAGADEVVCVRDLATQLVAQSASKPGLGDLLTDLLRASPGTYEFDVETVDTQHLAQHRTFRQTARAYAAPPLSKLLIGVSTVDQRTGARSNLFNPDGEAARLHEGQQLISIGRKPTET
jgi:hypothetical protein